MKFKEEQLENTICIRFFEINTYRVILYKYASVQKLRHKYRYWN